MGQRPGGRGIEIVVAKNRRAWSILQWGRVEEADPVHRESVEPEALEHLVEVALQRLAPSRRGQPPAAEAQLVPNRGGGGHLSVMVSEPAGHTRIRPRVEELEQELRFLLAAKLHELGRVSAG